MVVVIARVRCLGANAFGAGLGVASEGARRAGGHAGGATVADKVAFVEELHEGVFSVAGDRAGVADAGGCERFVRGRRGRVTGQAGEEALAEGPEGLRAGVEGLFKVRTVLREQGRLGAMGMLTYGITSRASASSRIWLSMNLGVDVSYR